MEVESITAWKEQFEAQIKKRDEEAEEGFQKLQEEGEQELSELKEKRTQAIEDNFNNCRSTEEAFVAARDDTDPGNAWKRLAELVDFSSKAYKGQSDISRMRTLLLQLKQNGLAASPTNDADADADEDEEEAE
eukprot:m.94585 g.94585  ORF g.94585 m.94585 type:complete len:133 (+) comp8925_c0_seq1:117-515(+)